jgi:hypothetical protein
MPYDVAADDRAVPSTEFSGSLVKAVKGRHYHAQVFVTGDRFPIGDAMAAGCTAQLFEVHTDHRSRNERFYDWVDQETGVVLKLVSLIESGHSSMSSSDCRLSLPRISKSHRDTTSVCRYLSRQGRDRKSDA